MNLSMAQNRYWSAIPHTQTPPPFTSMHSLRTARRKTRTDDHRVSPILGRPASSSAGIDAPLFGIDTPFQITPQVNSFFGRSVAMSEKHIFSCERRALSLCFDTGDRRCIQFSIAFGIAQGLKSR
ncbi:hypothetical protein BC936DRAFT_149365 [Jimgerdemannia flammicorona]|uniref:Uncharacterized protein n=2 Tax=Jimgerdemannia flammicorona TaxID=994334 RepID=A0A433DK88_9FUNG|nr:hypothetical protein BC936DRAFT_149365 [Jimgerdemannia flammicorona]RUS25700.1 hypothetical protein BC938DRAFT_471776 [Jimgerdemannia flammicorona]